MAICFRTPPYTTPYTTDVREPVKVQVQLVRISDNVKGPSVEFQYIPMIPLNRKNNLISMEQVDAAPNINYQHNLNINYGSNGLTQTFFGYNTENDFQNFMDF